MSLMLCVQSTGLHNRVPACWVFCLIFLAMSPMSQLSVLTPRGIRDRYMDEHGIDVHCLVPLPWLECEPALHADDTKALEVNRSQLSLLIAGVRRMGWV